MSVLGVPAQDLPENTGEENRYFEFQALQRNIEVDEKGEPKEELGSDGFPRTEDGQMATAPVVRPAPEDDMPQGYEGPGAAEMVGPEVTEPAAEQNPPRPLAEANADAKKGETPKASSEPADNDKLPKSKNMSRQAKKDQHQIDENE